MFNNEELKRLAEGVLKYDFKDVAVIDADEVFVSIRDGRKTVGGKTIPQKLRALSLLAINNDKDACEIHQKPVFKKLGLFASICVSPLRVEKAKEFILKAALAGATEVIYELTCSYNIPSYPHYGYLKGAYTDDELREIDNFAAELEMELIPTIQTLGHLGGYLSAWGEETSAFHDRSGILLCDCDETYRFLDAKIGTIRKLFRSERINLAMDEVHDLGFGKYYDTNGYKDRFDTFRRHLVKTMDICKKYDFQPMIWSDSLFNLGCGEGSYYLPDVKFPQSVVDSMPSLDIIYWDYYSLEKSEYETIIDNHRQLPCNVVFAGAGRTEAHTMIDITGAFKATVPGLKACMDKGVDEVWCTLWGAYPFFDALYSFAAYSEICYNPDATTEDFDKMGSLLSGISTELKEQINKYFELVRFPRHFLFSDVLHNVTGIDFKEDTKYLGLPSVIAECKDEYTRLHLEIAYNKLSIWANMQDDYKAGKDMSIYSEKLLPKLLSDYKRLFELLKKRYLSDNKPFGFDSYFSPFYKMYGQIEYAIAITDAYVKGKTDRIEDLDFEPIYGMPKSGA